MTPRTSRYLAEALGTALLMLAIAGFAVVLEHPDSFVHNVLEAPWVRRLCMGVGMGTVVAWLTYSRFGQASGAHFNPALTLGMLRSGKIDRRDAAGYIAAQFAGGALAMGLGRLVMGDYLAHPDVGFVATVPAEGAVALALLVETAMSFTLMAMVLASSSSRRLAPYTGALAGVLIALFVLFEAPLSGMSINPARTVSSAWVAREWTAVWIYFAGPVAGMALAAEVQRRRLRPARR